MICSSALDFSSFNPDRPTLSLATNRQFYCTGVIIYNKLDNYFVTSADRQTFLGFEITANLCDTSSLIRPWLKLILTINCIYNLTFQAHHQKNPNQILES